MLLALAVEGSNATLAQEEDPQHSRQLALRVGRRTTLAILGCACAVVLSLACACIARRWRESARAKAARSSRRGPQREADPWCCFCWRWWMSKAGWSTGPFAIELGEFRLGHVADRITHGHVRVEVQPSQRAPGHQHHHPQTSSATSHRVPALRTRSGHLTSTGDVTGTTLAFTEVMMVWAEGDDDPVTFSVFCNDELMDDRIASATVSGRALLDMARQREEYFDLELQTEDNYWEPSRDGTRPYLALRIRELPPDKAKMQSRQGSRAVLHKRGSGLPN